MKNQIKKIGVFLFVAMGCIASVNARAQDFLKIPLHANNVSFNPTLEQDFSSLWVSRQINCQLIRNNAGEAKLEAAKQIYFLTPTTLDIKLHRHMTFSNGAPLTADDVIASLQFLKQKRTVLRNALDWIQGIKKVNPNEINIILKKPYPQFLHVFSAPNYAIFPKSFIGAAQKDSALWKNPITCGAYSVSNNTSAFLEIKPRTQGLPVRFYYFPDGVMTASQAQSFDIVLLEVKDPQQLTPHFHMVKIFDPFQFFYVPNTRKIPWNNRDARCALLARLNANNVMRVYGHLVKPALDLIPSGTLGYSDTAHYQASIQQAGAALPLPHVKQFCFVHFQSSLEKNIRTQFEKMFEKLFPHVRRIGLTSSENMSRQFQQTHCDGMLLALKSNYLDAYEYLLLFSETNANVSGYVNPALVSQIESSQQIVQSDFRAKTYRKIIHQLRQQCLIYPLFTMPYDMIYVRNGIDPVNIGAKSLDEYLLSHVIRQI